jgi:hypothetical protein
MFQDLRIGIRVLLHSRGFSLVAVLCLTCWFCSRCR